MEPVSVGSRIASWRAARGLSVRDLAARCGVTYSALSRIEKGRQAARAEEVERIAAALGLSMPEFYAEPSAPQQEG